MKGFTPFPSEFADRYRKEGYWRGEVLGSLLRDRNADLARIALVDCQRSWSYMVLDQKVDRVAAGLFKLGIRRGDRVVVQFPNVAEFAIVAIALFRLGAMPVFALAAHRRNEIMYLCDYSEAVAYITIDTHFGFDYRGLAREVLAGTKTLKHVVIAGVAAEFVPLQELEAEPIELPPPSPSDVAFFLLSGGTTGVPKLIPRTHDDYSYQLRETAVGLRFGEHSVYLAALPVAHNAALGCPGLLGALRIGGKVVLLTSPSPNEAFPLIAREGATHTTLMPPLVHLWLEAAEVSDVDLSGLLLQVGSARMAPDIARRARSELGCKLTQWFGMAEGLLTFTRLDDVDDIVDNTVGRPMCAADEIRIVDEDDQDVPVGITGELINRGPYTIRGYYNTPEHNAQVFTPDGFLRTGDLASLTPDGNMIVQGRRKDVINRGGEKVVPAELEDLLVNHPCISQVAVVGVPDPILGERVCAALIADGPPVKLQEVRAYLRERGVADFKLPDRVENVASFPFTKIGKVNKTKLQEELAGRANR
jgi:2,3-dihydroxybenzoate-AMP ligase